MREPLVIAQQEQIAIGTANAPQRTPQAGAQLVEFLAAFECDPVHARREPGEQHGVEGVRLLRRRPGILIEEFVPRDAEEEAGQIPDLLLLRGAQPHPSRDQRRLRQILGLGPPPGRQAATEERHEARVVGEQLMDRAPTRERAVTLARDFPSSRHPHPLESPMPDLSEDTPIAEPRQWREFAPA